MLAHTHTLAQTHSAHTHTHRHTQKTERRCCSLSLLCKLKPPGPKVRTNERTNELASKRAGERMSCCCCCCRHRAGKLAAPRKLVVDCVAASCQPARRRQTHRQADIEIWPGERDARAHTRLVLCKRQPASEVCAYESGGASSRLVLASGCAVFCAPLLPAASSQAEQRISGWPTSELASGLPRRRRRCRLCRSHQHDELASSRPTGCWLWQQTELKIMHSVEVSAHSRRELDCQLATTLAEGGASSRLKTARLGCARPTARLAPLALSLCSLLASKFARAASSGWRNRRTSSGKLRFSWHIKTSPNGTENLEIGTDVAPCARGTELAAPGTKFSQHRFALAGVKIRHHDLDAICFQSN